MWTSVHTSYTQADQKHHCRCLVCRGCISHVRLLLRTLSKFQAGMVFPYRSQAGNSVLRDTCSHYGFFYRKVSKNPSPPNTHTPAHSLYNHSSLASAATAPNTVPFHKANIPSPCCSSQRCPTRRFLTGTESLSRFTGGSKCLPDT